MRYSFGDKRKLITIGQYPSVSLEQTRENAIGYKKLILAEADPQENKKLDKAAKIKMKEGQLHLVVEAWLKFKEKQVTYSTLKRDRRMMEQHLLPNFSKYESDRKIVSSTHIEDIAHSDITHIIAKIQDYRVELARRLFAHCLSIWQFALGRGYTETNCLFKIDTKQLLLPKVTNHYEKITDEATLGELLRAIDGYIHSSIIRSALKFVSIIPLRAENLATLKWSYIDFEKKILTIPRSEMKVKKKSFPNFSLPLPTQAIEILKEIKKKIQVGVFGYSTDTIKYINRWCQRVLIKLCVLWVLQMPKEAGSKHFTLLGELLEAFVIHTKTNITHHLRLKRLCYIIE
ncbi:tyrosine-type recombinase/integrase [Helicobacter cinaedi]|uniref:tyrosine-type recombinase/integrase n=1 Tax=Helicobacter cinaedi TaxID=213 RepID=UPI001FB29331|nr:integrase arm-type DNA-binding domain-containing protein [Helicobacter cinaedi]